MQKNHSKARIIARPATPPTTPPTMAPMSTACQIWGLNRQRFHSLVPPSDFSESVAAPVAIADEVTRIDPFESVTVTTLYHKMSMKSDKCGLLHLHNTGKML